MGYTHFSYTTVLCEILDCRISNFWPFALFNWIYLQGENMQCHILVLENIKNIMIHFSKNVRLQGNVLVFSYKKMCHYILWLFNKNYLDQPLNHTDRNDHYARWQ